MKLRKILVVSLAVCVVAAFSNKLDAHNAR